MTGSIYSALVRTRPARHLGMGLSGWAAAVAGLLLILGLQSARAAAASLEAISFASLPGDRVQLALTMSEAVSEPLSFTIDNPARIALDFPRVHSAVEHKSQAVGIGAVRSVTAVEAGGRTRVVVNLVQMVPYETRVEGKQVFVTLGGGIAASAAIRSSGDMVAPAGKMPQEGHSIRNVDFRRGEHGEARLMVTLSDPGIGIDMKEEAGNIVVDFIDSRLPEELERRLDVVDFATPVQTVDTFKKGPNVRMVIKATGDYDHLAYQSESLFTVEVKPLTKEEAEKARKEQFSGERLSLNFQNIEVRAVLQLLADFTGLNLVTSDTVGGSLTLRLKNVPWDQALDIILKTRGLAMRQTGNVIYVAPSDEIIAREKLELETRRQVEELAPLRTDYVQINYAKASDLAALLKKQGNTMLSERGNVTIDGRTNTLLVQDTADKLAEIRKLVAKLDVPIRQVLIESRIVIATDDFAKDLGVRFGVTSTRQASNGNVISTTGSLEGTSTITADAISNLQSTGQPFPVATPSQNNRLNVSLPATPSSGQAGSIAFAILGSKYLVDLELSALQAEGRGEVISNPRVITANQKQATIEQGEEIPYQEASSSGATSVSFKKAVLSLRVTPQITPDDNIVMDLTVSQDSRGQDTAAGIPAINTQQVTTQVLVKNGETVVLGGIYQRTRTKDITGVPVLSELPVLGNLFKSTGRVDNKRELLIFVTPKIIKESLGL